jgi:peroxiredoxin
MSKKKHRRNSQKPYPVLPIAAGLLLIGFALTFLASPASRSDAESLSSVKPLAVNFPAPELSLPNLNGETESLSDYRDTVVLVNNWATWCPPCKAEMPTLSAYHNEHKPEGFTIVAIEAGSSADVVAPFVQSYDLAFPVWLDGDGAALKAFGNGNLPNSYVIDRSGMVRYAWTGEINQAMLEKYVTPLLKENN